MNFLDCFLKPYEGANSFLITLEIIAAVSGILSVWFAKKERIWVFPTGLISTGIYTYLLHIYELRGDMLINAYYFIMSIFGWYNWARTIDDEQHHIPISRTNFRQKIWMSVAFVAGILFVFLVYRLFDTDITTISYLDAFTTSVFFVAMWLMALKKIENWTWWIVGNLISIPLYLVKGLCFTFVQYVIFLILAIAGYLEWRNRRL